MKLKKLKKQLITKKILTIWKLIIPYWISKDWIYAWGLTISLIFFLILTVHASILLNKWNAIFYDSLQTKNTNLFYKQIWQFCWLLIYLLITFVSACFCSSFLSLRWRIWLTNKFIDIWIKKQIYYKISLYKSTDIDNPDQRISIDINNLAFKGINLGKILFQAIIQFISFSIILWELSKSLKIKFFFFEEYYIPGYMMWIAIIYSIVSTTIVKKIGKPLIYMDYLQEKFEANFRNNLIKIRENSNEIALGQKEQKEIEIIKLFIKQININYQNIIIRTIYINSYQNIFMNTSAIIPLLIISPQFFDNTITLGVMMQIANAFGSVERAISVIMNNYQIIASCTATIDRLIQFKKSIKIIEEKATKINKTMSLNINIINLQLYICRCLSAITLYFYLIKPIE